MANRHRPVVIVAFPVDPLILEGLREHYAVHYVPDPAQRQAAVRTLGAAVQAVITNGTYGWSAEPQSFIDLVAGKAPRGWLNPELGDRILSPR